MTFKKAKTTKLGGMAYQNEKVPFLNVTWPYHAKVIIATVPKLVLMKDAYNHRPRDLWLCDILINEKHHITTFTKAFCIKFEIKKKHRIKCIHSLDSKIT